MDVKTLQQELYNNRKALEPKVVHHSMLSVMCVLLPPIYTSHKHMHTHTHSQERTLSNQEVDHRSLQSALTAIQTELGTDLLSQLAPNEQKEVRGPSIAVMYVMIPGPC